MPFSTSPAPFSICVGTVLSARYIRSPHRNDVELTISLGNMGTVVCTEDIARQYELSELISRQVVVAIQRLPCKNGDTEDSITILGAEAKPFGLTLLAPDRLVPSGSHVL